MAYKSKRRRVGTIRYYEPNPKQSQSSYIAQFYRLNKGLIDKAYTGIGTTSPYEHFKAEALDLLAERKSKGQPAKITWATSYQLGKASFVEASGGNTAVNNILRILRRTGNMQTLARLAGYAKSSTIEIENYDAWVYDYYSKTFTYYPTSTKTGKRLEQNASMTDGESVIYRAAPVTIWFSQKSRYPFGDLEMNMQSVNGFVKIETQGEDFEKLKKKKKK